MGYGKMIMEYYEENKHNYIKDFCEYLINDLEYNFSENYVLCDDELIQEFIDYMYNYKNIKITRVCGFWKEILTSSLKLVYELEKRGN